jgi:hypothetical protein
MRRFEPENALLRTLLCIFSAAQHNHIIERLAWQVQLFAGLNFAAPKFSVGPIELMIAPDGPL